MGYGHRKITLKPGVLKWARERSSLGVEALAKSMEVQPDHILEWERTGVISVARTKKLSAKTHTPYGYLFLSSPVKEQLPIPDFRTRGGEPPEHPSPDLLETVYAMQRRQNWMRDELIESGIPPLEFVGSFHHEFLLHGKVATVMREALQLTDNWASQSPSWTAAVKHLIAQSEKIGIMVVSNGIVGNSTLRKLNPEEFRGFSITDEYAPLIFINNADFKTAQMFTIAHELAHIFIGKGGVFSLDPLQPSDHGVEGICNRIAAEFLLPEKSLRPFWRDEATEVTKEHPTLYAKMAQRFKVSEIVVARRAQDLNLIDQQDFQEFYGQYLAREKKQRSSRSGGGNFWYNQRPRIGKRFAEYVIRAVKEGRLPYTRAYSLTGLKGRTFEKLEIELGLNL